MKLYRQLALLKQRREKGSAEAPHFLSSQCEAVEKSVPAGHTKSGLRCPGPFMIGQKSLFLLILG